jgi:4-hydroxy-3-polyprenylbenzoate decarboxylase
LHQVAARIATSQRRLGAASACAASESGLGSKIALDATNKWPPETKREWGRKIAMDEEVVKTVTEKWSRLGLPGSGKPIWK